MRSAYNGLNRNFPNNEWGNYMSRVYPYYNDKCFIYIDPNYNPIVRLNDATTKLGVAPFCAI